MRGKFIVLEGIDGCGKTTQIDHLSNWLPSSGLIPKGKKLHLTREPGGTELGRTLRQLLLQPSTDNSPAPLTELLLYAADRAQHISQLVQPALAKGDWVLSDRFSGSTLAYQGYGRQLSIEIIQQLELIATNGLIPDISFLLDVPINKSITRRKAKSVDRIEAEGSIFLRRVHSGFITIAKERNWVKIKGDNNIIDVSKRLEFEIQNFFKDI